MVDPLWALPISPLLVDLAAEYDVVITLEDNLVDGGVGQRLAARVAQSGSTAKVLTFGIPQEFLTHGSREEVLDGIGLNAARASMDALGVILSDEASEEPATHT